jgi:AcrR family transcriptional regulator
MSQNIVNQEERSTKQKILICAANLFALNGYTETSIRELAEFVGLNGASIYSHFSSKKAILENILEDYLEQVWGNNNDKPFFSHLQENPTPDGIVSLMRLSFPDDKKDYYQKVLSVILQEQHRNPDIRKYVVENFINNELFIKKVFDTLKELNVIRRDVDPDIWMKIASSLLYSFANRMVLGIGDDSPEYSGKGMIDLLRDMYDVMFRVCGVEKS